ncbi:CAP domain-containing protein [Salinibacterium sp. NK8237]|nr:CAP domain-containing protein [Salinibacterium sp. NK8237]
MNEARWDDGQLGLIRNAEMDAVALAWAKKMAASNNMSHNPDYSAQIPTGWRSAGENVAQGYRTAQAMHDGWMASKGHRENILGAFTDIGIAFYTSGGTTWGVQVFATYPGHTGPDASTAVAAPTADPEPSEESSETPASSATPTPTPTPTASETAEAGSGTDSSSGSASSGTIGEVDTTVAPTLSQAELQASVYGARPDYTWISWTIFFSLLALGAGFWFLMWRRMKSRRPVGRRARK